MSSPRRSRWPPAAPLQRQTSRAQRRRAGAVRSSSTPIQSWWRHCRPSPADQVVERWNECQPQSEPRSGFAVRTRTEAHSVAGIRSIVRQLDPQATVDNVATMTELVSNSIARPRLYAVVLGMFAAVAVLLAAIGIYGV